MNITECRSSQIHTKENTSDFFFFAFLQYGIVDVVTMVSEVADHQDILRSLGKTVLVKILVKKTVQQLDRDKRIPAGEIQDELNDQVK